MIESNLEPAELSKRGIAAARAGRNDEAREYLLAAVEADEHNEQAWLWLGGVMPEVEDQIVCLENALTLNPDNEPAQRKLNQLYAKRSALPVTPLPGSPSAPPLAATQDLYLSSPSATQTLPEPPFGALPWDLPSTAATGDTSSLPSRPYDTPPANPWASPAAPADHELFAPDSSLPHYSPGEHSDQRAGSDWPPTAVAPASPFGYTPDHNLEQHLPRYAPGGHSEQRVPTERGSLDNYDFASSTAPSTVNPFLSPSPNVGYSTLDTGSVAAPPPRYTSASSDFSYAAEADSEPDERLDCPYCGWHTRLEDERCPNCGGDLYIRTRSNENRSPALWGVVTLWAVRALRTAFSLGLAITLAEVTRRMLQSMSTGIDMKTATQYGLTAATINEATARSETTLAIFYGVLIALYAVMAIGSWMRVRIFYYLGLGVAAISVVGDIAAYLFDPIKSSTLLIFGIISAIALFLAITRAEGDFLLQKQRIIEPPYRGEASATGFYNLGSRYQKAGFTALAAKTWRRAISMSPGDLRIRMALAVAYNKMKRYDLSQEQLTEALRIDPNDIRAMNLMAIVKVRLGNYDEARHYIATALQIKPDDPDTLDNKQLIEQEIKRASAKPEPKKTSPAPQETKKVAS